MCSTYANQTHCSEIAVVADWLAETCELEYRWLPAREQASGACSIRLHAMASTLMGGGFRLKLPITWLGECPQPGWVYVPRYPNRPFCYKQIVRSSWSSAENRLPVDCDINRSAPIFACW